MNAHTVTVGMEEPSVQEGVVKALNQAGYTAGEPRPAAEGAAP
jgi:hypothetical protein